MIYIAEIKTIAGTYFRFYETIELTKRKVTVQAIGVKPYTKISETEFQVEPDPDNHFGPVFTVQKNCAGIYIESNTKKGLQRIYLTGVYDPDCVRCINVFDKSKFKGAA